MKMKEWFLKHGKQGLLILGFICLTFFIVIGIEIYQTNSCSIEALKELKVFIVNRDQSYDYADIDTYLKNGMLLFTGNDIKEFDWEKQTVTMTSDFMKNRPSYRREDKKDGLDLEGGSIVLGVNAAYSFALLLGDKLLYTGEFKPSLVSSHMPLGVIIGDVSKDQSSFDILPDTFGIYFTKVMDGRDTKEDKRFHKDLYQFLQYHKLIKE